MSSMAEVVEESLRLLSEVRSISREDLAEHVAAELAKAGYGNMADAWDACNATDTPWINPYRGAGHE